ncbi:MAG: DAK2 domain-containing protein [Dehalococcoidia bacterium]
MEPPQTLNADRLRHVFRTAERWLELNREPINAINVYPVPDGDTGTNMLLTLRAAIEAGEPASGATAGAYVQAMARGALLGARGNSGVILSQIVRGLADSLDGTEEVDAAAMRAGLTGAAEAAYGAVAEPVEGTMLTVIREAAAAASAIPQDATLGDVLDAAAFEAQASVERTPSLLPRLAEAGVVDAGGLGVAVLLAGIRFGYLNEDLPEPLTADASGVELSGVEHEGHGYCTEFVIVGSALDRERLHATLDQAGGESVLVVGYEDALHVHVHMVDPGPALSAGAAAGALESVKVENMQAQHDVWAEGHEQDGTPAELPALGLVAVTQGAGIASAFRELGATQIVDGGPTANPSAGELLDAARLAGRERVFLLPNDPNVIMAAEQAAEQEPELITIIPTRSVAGGFGAALAYSPDGDPETVAAAMCQAIEGVHCVEVTRSVRDTTADGVEVAQGDAIVLVDGTLIARANSLEDALMTGLGEVANGAELVTLYLGADAPDGAQESVPSLIEAAHEGIDVEVVIGGQPHYPYILGVE